MQGLGPGSERGARWVWGLLGVSLGIYFEVGDSLGCYFLSAFFLGNKIPKNIFLS